MLIPGHGFFLARDEFAIGEAAEQSQPVIAARRFDECALIMPEARTQIDLRYRDAEDFALAAA